jgi:hypothetical protein
MPDITQIIPPRVPLVDADTGLIAREWYRFFFNQFEKVGSSSESLEDLQLRPTGLDNLVFEIAKAIKYLNTDPAQDGVVDQIAEIQKQIDGLNSLPPQVQSAVASVSGVTAVTGTAPVVSSGGTTPDISMAAANTTTNGYLTSTDWNTFNGKQPAGTYVTSVSATSPVTSTGGVTPTIAMPAANSTTSGYLTSTDWNTFNTRSASSQEIQTATSGQTVFTLTTMTYTPNANNLSVYVNGVNQYGPSALYAYTETNSTTVTFTSAVPVGASVKFTTMQFVSSGNNGTVTNVSVASSNGFAGTVLSPGTTPVITMSTTVTGLLKGNGTAISAAVANTDYVPLSTVLTRTADYTITGTDTWIINNKTGSALTLTFPAASAWPGRYITVKNMQAQLVNSASSNIVPIDSTTAGTAILLAVVGNWATMVSDGTNWVIMQAAGNNNLLLE